MRNPFHDKKRMNHLLLPRDYSTIRELIIVFNACIFLTGNVLAFVENCSQAHSCANLCVCVCVCVWRGGGGGGGGGVYMISKE